MAKARYEKVEHELQKGVEKLKVGKLLEEADEAAGKKKVNNDDLTPKQKMIIVKQELKWLYKRDRNIYKTLKINKKEINRVDEVLKKSAEPITGENLSLVDKWISSIQTHKKNNPQPVEDLVNNQRSSHVYKRHNTKEKWIPLDTHADWNKHSKP